MGNMVKLTVCLYGNYPRSSDKVVVLLRASEVFMKYYLDVAISECITYSCIGDVIIHKDIIHDLFTRRVRNKPFNVYQLLTQYCVGNLLSIGTANEQHNLVLSTQRTMLKEKY